MPEPAHTYNLSIESQLSDDLLKTLLYFDVFQYPLTKDELLFFCPAACEDAQVDLALVELIDKGMIYKFERFYSLHNAPALVERRLAGNNLATQRMKTAKRVSRLISWFPFVRSVMLSGSISKGYMDKGSDLDFFIVTAPGKLWITRMFLVLFKRIFLFNSHKNFCVNYFIDTENLEIEEQNLFTAIESVTLIPTYGENCYYEFWTANQWVQNYFPNSAPRETNTIRNGNALIKSFSERLFDNRLGNAIDQYFMNVTLKRWKQLFEKRFSKRDFEVAFKTKKYASKNHPRFYQKSILDKYQDKIREFEENFNITLSSPLK
ncbi:nucleotidyltransferase domain-containing protein [Fulvivirga ulvae]|uniref:nucleotidyltransferase domain-containing protein n=1 Tax=Fulvivirga ulvae TaxID=2904245 RepID=UPI001F3EE88B|nr:nucleotidyltransferase domain-containing protein [Fulvivirga ulvae]UII34360.1 nucleotidyltransferase domain-containing protein [Fulvivirga ulvae]